MKARFQSYKQQVIRLWRWLVGKDLLIFLMFVGLVTIIWWGRTMSSSLRDAKFPIDIIYSGVDDCIQFSTPLPTQIEATISDEGRNLRHLTKQNLTITLDLSSYFTEKQGTFTLTSDIIRPRLQDILPSTAMIEQLSPDKFETSYQLQHSKRVPILLKYNVQCIPQYQLKGSPILSLDSIMVYGTEDMVNSIDSICTQAVTLVDVSDTVRQTVALQIPSTVRAKHTSVQATFIAEQFTDKTFTLPIQVTDVPQGEYVRLFPKETTVTVRVGVSSYAKVQASDIVVYCNYPTQTRNTLNVNAHSDNPHISNIRLYPSSVEYIIER